MNLLKLIREMKRTVRTSLLRVSVTNAKGETQVNEAPIKTNKITSLAGNGLTGFHIYQLAKHKKCELVYNGDSFVYEILPYTPPVAPEKVETATEHVEEGGDDKAAPAV